jgi:FeS assembly SUF system regulator
MLRVTKLADYGIIILTHFATGPQNTYTARGIANAAKLPLPIASKALKLLSKAGLLISQRGIKGGYGLARRPEDITVASIIHALEGPIALTECSGAISDCGLQEGCPIQTNWLVINNAIHSALERITLAQMTRPLHLSLVELKIPDSAPADPLPAYLKERLETK